MAVPYQIAGSLTFSPDTGAPSLIVALTGSGQFVSRQDGILNLVGSGTQSLPMGTLSTAGVKAVLIEVDPNSTSDAIIVKVNGSSTGGLEVAPGGALLVHNPRPLLGITQLDISYTTANVVRYWLLGD